MRLNETIFMVIRYLHNGGVDFVRGEPEIGEFCVENGLIALRGSYKPGHWVLIRGSELNDGIYVIESGTGGFYCLGDGDSGEGAVRDEAGFFGEVWRLRFPAGFLRLCEEITEFENLRAKSGDIVSESVAGFHTFRRATGKDGRPFDWADVFASRLPPKVMFPRIVRG